MRGKGEVGLTQESEEGKRRKRMTVFIRGTRTWRKCIDGLFAREFFVSSSGVRHVRGRPERKGVEKRLGRFTYDIRSRRVQKYNFTFMYESSKPDPGHETERSWQGPLRSYPRHSVVYNSPT